MLSVVSHSINPIFMLITNPSSLDLSSEHCFSVNSTSSFWKRSEVLCKRDVHCRGVSMEPCLKLSCDNCKEEKFFLNFYCV